MVHRIEEYVNVWCAFPTATGERCEKAISRWHNQGYKMAVWCDSAMPLSCTGSAYVIVSSIYPGYWKACNQLAKAAVEQGADIVIFAADDIDPDPRFGAEEIGRQFREHFPDWFGVMQPCGDKQGMDHTGRPAAARICGSPWLGKNWVKRAHQGRGATDDRYFHFYGDEALYEVANKLGVLWMRPDLTQFHRHWSWGHSNVMPYQERNSRDHWAQDQALFFREKEAGFPTSGPLEVL